MNTPDLYFGFMVESITSHSAALVGCSAMVIHSEMAPLGLENPGSVSWHARSVYQVQTEEHLTMAGDAPPMQVL
jgi:hypothetical protein